MPRVDLPEVRRSFGILVLEVIAIILVTVDYQPVAKAFHALFGAVWGILERTLPR